MWTSEFHITRSMFMQDTAVLAYSKPQGSNRFQKIMFETRRQQIAQVINRMKAVESADCWKSQ